MTLLLSPTRAAVPLGPAWAVLCGAIAAPRWQWRGSTLLALTVSALIAEVLWSSWRAHLRTDWQAVFAAHPLPARRRPKVALPYTKPSSPLGRALGQLQQVWQWVREAPAAKSAALVAAIALLPGTLLLAALVGRQMLLLSLTAQALALIEWRAHHYERPGHVFQAAVEILLPWLAGHAAQAPITPMSLLLACCFGLTYQGALSLERAPRDTRAARQCRCDTLATDGRSRTPSRSWSLFLYFAGQAIAAAALLLASTSQTLYLVAGMGLLLAPQALLLVYAGDTEKPPSYLRRAAPFVMVSMAIAAWVA